jgi:16S rRNA C967 or C1407 C5-methylase (RsmB/RsmF family)
MPLLVKQQLSARFPSYYSHRYLQEQSLGRDDLSKLDAENRQAVQKYIRNIHTMEQITRLNTNLDLLRKHQQQNLAAKTRTIDVELLGMRIADFVVTSFPGELTVQIGLNIKEKSPHEYTFVAGYSNGYIYYAPTTEQLKNVGGAQEDSDCILAPQWQAIYERKAAEILARL